jgi:hypothetical protein
VFPCASPNSDGWECDEGKASEQVNGALISEDSETSERRKRNSAPSLHCTVALLISGPDLLCRARASRLPALGRPLRSGIASQFLALHTTTTIAGRSKIISYARTISCRSCLSA